MDILALLRRHGNTLICEGSNGRIFEVTPAGEIVWEYVNPFPNLKPRIPSREFPTLLFSAQQRWPRTG